LVLSAGDLVPAFAAGTKEYTMSVANGVATTTVTATRSQTGQVIKLGSTTLTSGAASAAKNLAVGENIINVAVTSADGNATATYQVLVTRAAGA
jgi:co-chaperonin GroES (HSP10)